MSDKGEGEMPLTLTRSFFAIILPGVVLIAPWVLMAVQANAGLADLYKEYTVPANVCAFSLVVMLGAVVEGLGTYVEKRWDRKAGSMSRPDDSENWLDKDWFDYLARQFDKGEPVAYRYLSRKVTELYFELGMMIASPIGAVGVAFILREHISSIFVYASFLSAPLISYWFFRSARDTHCVLYDTRYRINARLNSMTGNSDEREGGMVASRK
ncbi:hypothetical protein [Dyella sp. 2HG41-7]|uniref:hypothetical protein n=1 Tax=Dyella sp. 2HG41-7 TaxID=2883239 RepID=UPI001F2168E7|nr:hypothetical protein [Dyella sp. 2HG41-7]